jgi:uncharacterized sulfatase
MKKMMTILLIVLLLNIASINCCSTETKPNIVLILVDDLNTSLGCYGHYLARTPNIDNLAREGVLFTAAYCQYPLCNPSRTSFLSGRRPETTGVLDNTTHPRTRLKDKLFLPEYFEQHGYYTVRTGKIEHRGFSDGVIHWKEAFLPKEKQYDAISYGHGLPGWLATNESDEETSDGTSIAKAIQFLETGKPHAPFLLAVGIQVPHRPYVAPRKYFDLYRLSDIRLPPRPEGKLDGVTDDQLKQLILAYLACVSLTDALIGKLIEAIERLGFADNTIIMLSSDHGVDAGERGRYGKKQALYEEVVRVPLIIKTPGQPSGATSPALVELVDLYQTLAELCGLPEPDGMEGRSLVPLLSSPSRKWKKGAFSANRNADGSIEHSVRTERFHLIRSDDGSRVLFYDLLADPMSETNVAEDPRYRSMLKHTKKVLKKGWRHAMPD